MAAAAIGLDGGSLMSARSDALARLADAQAFLDAAETIMVMHPQVEYADVVATNAIHAGIAASDALCLITLGGHSKADNHVDAVRYLRSAGGDHTTLGRLLTMKTRAGYGVQSLTVVNATRCIEWAKKLVAAAETKVSPP